MQLRRIGLLAVIGVSGAFSFGVLANFCLDLVWPLERAAIAAPAQAAAPSRMALASVSSQPVRLDPAPAPVAAPAPAAAADEVIGTRDIRPVKVKTIHMVLTNPEPQAAPATALAYAAPAPTTPNPATAAIMPKPRPAVREAAAPKAAAKHRPSAEDEQLVLSDGQIERMKTALALTPDQEGYWPAVATELRAIGKAQPKRSATRGAAPKLQVDDDSVQRLYAAATPLIMRLREDQKRTVRQFAQMLGLQEVAQAL